jgi:hypothetical protein
MCAANRRYRDWPNEAVVHNLFGLLYDSANEGAYAPEEEQMLLSEDHSFCKRWRRIGGKVMVYMNAGVIAHGGTKTWSVRDMKQAAP